MMMSEIQRLPTSHLNKPEGPANSTTGTGTSHAVAAPGAAPMMASPAPASMRASMSPAPPSTSSKTSSPPAGSLHSSAPPTTENGAEAAANVSTAASSQTESPAKAQTPAEASVEATVDGGNQAPLVVQSQPPTPSHNSTNPAHPNTKTTTHVNNGTTTTKTNISSPVCHNCKTQTTPLWRRDETGQVLCNACGLFLKLHGRPRPSSLKTDTIKSRNRVKQHSNNSNKSSTPNTPKLESKDSNNNLKIYNTITSSNPTTTNNSNNVMKRSPKLNKKADVPYQINSQQPKGQQQQMYTQSFNNPSLPNYNHHLSNHLSHPVQPLHYPSSTPTSFAPGLQRITSPLLLSNTSSISNTRSSNATGANNGVNPPGSAAASIHQAAGALENMSNELGPSATFQKNSKITTPISLINNNKVQIKREPSPIFSTPSSALNYPKPMTPNSKPINSPSFGPQFHLAQPHGSNSNSNSNSNSTSPKQMETLPPIQQVASMGKPSLPHISNITPVDSNSGNNSGSNRDTNDNSRGTGQNVPSGSDNSNNDRKKDDEITILKTRISELELVNDLYRTRIMELEAMEQAARLRENSMRRRLDEIISLQDGGDNKRPRYDHA